MDDFTKRFNKVLDDSGLTGTQISELLNIHPPTLVKYKTGKSLMSMQTLYHFCKTFNVSADWLMGLSSSSNDYLITGRAGAGKSNTIKRILDSEEEQT